MVAPGVLVFRSLVVSGRHASPRFVVVVVCSWVEYQQAYARAPAHGNPLDQYVLGWCVVVVWWHIVGLSINKPSTRGGWWLLVTSWNIIEAGYGWLVVLVGCCLSTT